MLAPFRDPTEEPSTMSEIITIGLDIEVTATVHSIVAPHKDYSAQGLWWRCIA
jgi:hypothetical protein